MRAAALRSLVAALCLFLLAACAGLPTSSSVSSGKAVSAEDNADPLTVMPDGPLPDDDPQQIATGFLRAQMWSTDNYSLARSFLTSEASKQWRPGTSITVFDDTAGISVTRPDVNTVRVRVGVLATLSADGHLHRRSSPEFRTLDFTAESQRAGWRLSSVPKDLGLWMGEGDFTRLYKAANVYYPSAYGHAMVPDPRWLPRQGLTTALARAALTAPPQWLAPAVTFPFPRGTTLDVESVPVSSNGTAAIDVSSAAQGGTPAQHSAMWASLVATVMQAPEVQSVSVSSRGSQLEAENLPSVVKASSDVGYQMPTQNTGAVIARTGTNLAWIDPSAYSAEAGTSPSIAAGRPHLPAVPAQWTRLAAGPGGRQIAAVSPDRTSLRRWVNGTNVTVGALGTDLVRPGFDVFGFMWCAGHSFADQPDSGGGARRGPAAIWAVDTSKDDGKGAPSALAVPWVGSASVDAMSVSPEGERVALVLDDHGHRSVVTAAVVRSASGVPISLGAPATIGGAGATDVVWADATNLAYLTSVGGHQEVETISVDGTSSSLGELDQAAELTSTGTGATGLFVTTSKHTVYSRLGSSWNSFATNGDLVAPSS